jgi:hypothetical protein
MEEAYSNGGTGIPEISLLTNVVFDDQLASKEGNLTFFLRVGVHIGILAVTVESSSCGEIGSTLLLGEQGAVVVVGEDEYTINADNKCMLPACGDMEEVPDVASFLCYGRMVSNLDNWIFLYCYILNGD